MKKLKKIGLLVSSLVLIGSLSNMSMVVNAASGSTQKFTAEQQQEALRKFLGTSTSETKDEERVEEVEEVALDNDSKESEVLPITDDESVDEIVELDSEITEEVVEEVESDLIFLEEDSTQEISEDDVDENSDVEMVETVFEDDFVSEFDTEKEDIHNSAEESKKSEEISDDDASKVSASNDEIIEELLADDSEDDVDSEDEVVAEDEESDETSDEAEESEDLVDVEDVVEETVEVEEVENVPSNSNYIIGNYDMIGLGVEGVEALLIIILMGMFLTLKGKVEKVEKFIMSQSSVRSSVSPSVNQPAVAQQAQVSQQSQSMPQQNVNNQGQIQ